jgi:hypothetical protein
MEENKYLPIIRILTLIAFVAAIIWVGSMFLKDKAEESKQIESWLGLHVVLDNDTLTVIDYSDLKKNYTLSSGVEISPAVLETLPLVTSTIQDEP